MADDVSSSTSAATLVRSSSCDSGKDVRVPIRSNGNARMAEVGGDGLEVDAGSKSEAGGRVP
jgi:hypothetical protein